jgi:hypothetical protein
MSGFGVGEGFHTGIINRSKSEKLENIVNNKIMEPTHANSCLSLGGYDTHG